MFTGIWHEQPFSSTLPACITFHHGSLCLPVCACQADRPHFKLPSKQFFLFSFFFKFWSLFFFDDMSWRTHSARRVKRVVSSRGGQVDDGIPVLASAVQNSVRSVRAMQQKEEKHLSLGYRRLTKYSAWAGPEQFDYIKHENDKGSNMTQWR